MLQWMTFPAPPLQPYRKDEIATGWWGGLLVGGTQKMLARLLAHFRVGSIRVAPLPRLRMALKL
jgi:hypothetical protein